MSDHIGQDQADIALARELLAEWDEGRGTSKSEIERRVWGDGGAHGRRFDRFIRQTLGVSTNRPSKQTDRIATLEAQLRRLGEVPRVRWLSVPERSEPRLHPQDRAGRSRSPENAR